MIQRILAIFAIFVCTAVAWGILGGTILSRTYASRSGLRGKVVSSWGAPQKQTPPKAEWSRTVETPEESIVDGKKITQTKKRTTRFDLPLEGSDIQANLKLEHRQKGLLWYSTYAVDFAGAYRFKSDSAEDQSVTFTLPLPTEQAVYDGLQLEVDGSALPITSDKSGARGTALVKAGQTVTLRASYRSQGLDSWQYSFGSGVSEAKDFRLRLTTNFDEIDFPENTLSPTSKKEVKGGWDLTWEYRRLLTGYGIGMAMPEKLQPGPLAGEISFFAPVSLLFFFFVVFLLATLDGVDFHPMNYFFLACAFFSFHLLLAYLVDHISVYASFAIASAVSVLLVWTYLRKAAPPRFTLQAVVAQLVYLVLFSSAFFFPGYTGLSVTILAVLTLFAVMQWTGGIRWSERFRGAASAPRPTTPG